MNISQIFLRIFLIKCWRRRTWSYWGRDMKMMFKPLTLLNEICKTKHLQLIFREMCLCLPGSIRKKSEQTSTPQKQQVFCHKARTLKMPRYFACEVWPCKKNNSWRRQRGRFNGKGQKNKAYKVFKYIQLYWYIRFLKINKKSIHLQSNTFIGIQKMLQNIQLTL